MSIKKEFQHNEHDTGSVEVQIIQLTERINDLSKNHFSVNPKDNHSRVGLLRMVGQRRKFLSYLQRKDVVTYEKLVDSLGLRR